MKNVKLQIAIQRGVSFIDNQQLVSGGFKSFSSPSQTIWIDTVQYTTTFTTSLVLNCLAALPGTTQSRQQMVNFLLGQRSPEWSFNYWVRRTPECKRFPYPDDLDDTFCALLAIYKNSPDRLTEDSLVRIIHLLIATEQKPGGPYRTWLTTADSPQPWQDVDIAVNANIAYFLELIGSPSLPLQAFLSKAIRNGSYESIYYPTSFPVWYYLARVCPPDSRKLLCKKVEGAAVDLNPLNAALALSALTELGGSNVLRSKLTQQLLRTQAQDGSWPACAFCIDPQMSDQKHYHGAATLTTAFAVEALQAQVPAQTVSQPADRRAQTIQKQILGRAQADLAALPKELKNSAQSMLVKMLASDTEQKITLLPYAFGQSLAEPLQENDKFYVLLGLANLNGWIAYTVYDDFLDQGGDPALLPVANLAHRASLKYFCAALPNHRIFRRQVEQTFTTMDAANSWEVAHCRSTTNLPDYGNLQKLAERSLGHTLTPLAVLLKSGAHFNGPAYKAVQNSLCHYLIARQLDDDAHDWQADLTAGQISYVVTQLMIDTAGKTDAQLQHIFWDVTLPKICTVMKEHLQIARYELASTDVLLPNNIICQLLDGLDQSVNTTLRKQQQAKKFMLSYRGFGESS